MSKADIRHGVFYATRFASPQGSLVPLTPQESLVPNPAITFVTPVGT